MWIFKAARQGFHASLEILLNIPGEGNPAGQVALEDVKTILRHDIQQGKDAGKNEEMLQMIVKSESENKQKLSELASLEEAAKKGDAEAQYKLVYMYVGRNKQKAFSWASRAAHQGSPQGMAALGELYYRGIGTDRNLDKAKEWLAKGAEQGAPAAQYNLGFLYEQGEGVEKNAQQAAIWYRKAAEQGFPAAQDKLGICYLEGLGVRKDEKEALVWLHKAARQGNSTAQYNLGVLHEKGKGTDQDLQQAAAWFRKAAEQGFAKAQFNLGIFYLLGTGVEKDERQGVMWIFKAAQQGLPRAMENLRHIPGEGSPAEQTALEEVKTILRHDIQQGKDAEKNEKLLRMIDQAKSQNQ